MNNPSTVSPNIEDSGLNDAHASNMHSSIIAAVQNLHQGNDACADPDNDGD